MSDVAGRETVERLELGVGGTTLRVGFAHALSRVVNSSTSNFCDPCRTS